MLQVNLSDAKPVYGRLGHMSSSRTPSVGDSIRTHRVRAKVSLRQLAERAGISNPYLSQIERGLRTPSREIIDKIAKALGTTAQMLLMETEAGENRSVSGVMAALQADEILDARQRRILIELYESFCRANQTLAHGVPGEGAAVPTRSDWVGDTLFDLADVGKGAEADQVEVPSATAAMDESAEPHLQDFLEVLMPGLPWSS
ncbi:helix-turn-helix domain-containing protein [Streptosporangium saharense]|uniref:Transcriptional regulator with XRE-family HTH domain n=1 Tax=Streptosporangium saharense TaxID=1706840 RepID=A0A7W7VPF5_9ACTN|nr:helix-turn-helix transcriptional regulator [Streptosporangium saharense]MBB4917459.1 transcriptional regulator with XRE-family HTH domain [Streptosporangium saharense]